MSESRDTKLMLTLHGVAYELLTDEEVRAKDLAAHALTVRRRGRPAGVAGAARR